MQLVNPLEFRNPEYPTSSPLVGRSHEASLHEFTQTVARRYQEELGPRAGLVLEHDVDYRQPRCYRPRQFKLHRVYWNRIWGVFPWPARRTVLAVDDCYFQLPGGVAIACRLYDPSLGDILKEELACYAKRHGLALVLFDG